MSVIPQLYSGGVLLTHRRGVCGGCGGNDNDVCKACWAGDQLLGVSPEAVKGLFVRCSPLSACSSSWQHAVVVVGGIV